MHTASDSRVFAFRRHQTQDELCRGAPDGHSESGPGHARVCSVLLGATRRSGSGPAALDPVRSHTASALRPHRGERSVSLVVDWRIDASGE